VCVCVCVCCVNFSLMRNVDSWGREIAGWELIASPDKPAGAQQSPAQLAHCGLGLLRQAPLTPLIVPQDLGRVGGQTQERGGTLPSV
jgi:hypothetical protein